MFLLSVYLAPAQDNRCEMAADRAEGVKSNLAKLGTGVDTKVYLTLSSGIKITGYVTRLEHDSFFVAGNLGDVTEIKYAEIARVAGINVSNGKMIAIGYRLLWLRD